MKTIRCLLCRHAWLNKIWFCETGRGWGEEGRRGSLVSVQTCSTVTLWKLATYSALHLERQTSCLILCLPAEGTHTDTRGHTQTRLNNFEFALMQQPWWARCLCCLHLWRWEMVLSRSYIGLAEPSHLQSGWGREGETGRVPGSHVGVMRMAVTICQWWNGTKYILVSCS